MNDCRAIKKQKANTEEGKDPLQKEEKY